MRSALLRGVVTCLIITLIFPVLSLDSTAAHQRVITYDTFETEKPVIALTFDVTFDRGDGAEILDILANRGVPATFAVTGVWARDNPDLIHRIVNEGHGLMNHTWDHYSLTGEFTGSSIHEQIPPLTYDQVINQLRLTEDLIRAQTGVELQPYVRPPYGDYSEDTLVAFADAGYIYNIMWTVDTFGWYLDPVEVVHQRAIEAAQPGANILMHIGHGSTDGAALPGIIDELRQMGYEFATVQQFVEGEFAQPEVSYSSDPQLELSGSFIRHWWRVDSISTVRFPGVSVRS